MFDDESTSPYHAFSLGSLPPLGPVTVSLTRESAIALLYCAGYVQGNGAGATLGAFSDADLQAGVAMLTVALAGSACPAHGGS